MMSVCANKEAGACAHVRTKQDDHNPQTGRHAAVDCCSVSNENSK